MNIEVASAEIAVVVERKLRKWLSEHWYHPYTAEWICGFLYARRVLNDEVKNSIQLNIISRQNSDKKRGEFVAWFEENIQNILDNGICLDEYLINNEEQWEQRI